MTEPKQAPPFGETTVGRSLISFLNEKDGYGENLPVYVQPLLWAAQVLDNMQVYEVEEQTREAARCALQHTKGFIAEAEQLLEVVNEPT